MAAIARSGAAVADSKKAAPRIDWLLLLATMLLIGVGLMSLYSISKSIITMDFTGRVLAESFRKQLFNLAVGIVPFSIFAFVHPRTWMKLASLLYVVNLGLLAAVLFLGKSAKGAERWIDIGPIQFQPSELAKLLVIITLASFYAARQDSIRQPSTFALGFLHVAAPMALIFKQPHLGATVVVLVIWIGVSIVAQIPSRFLLTAGGVFLLLAIIGLSIPSVRSKVLPAYQLDRIEGMVTSSKDVKGANYQTDRAAIAFGVGGVFGTGFLKGEQKTGRFIPDQQTDFIFTVVGEEGGLVGCALVLLCFAFFFYRVWIVMFATTDPYYRMLAAGVFTLLAFHTFVNIGMVLQLLPVVGLWLPFMSYGGTALWLCLACVGLLLSIRRRERPLLF